MKFLRFLLLRDRIGRVPLEYVAIATSLAMFLVIAALTLFSAAHAIAQTAPNRSLMSLIAAGYEVKAMTISGQDVFVLQKGPMRGSALPGGNVAEP
jgi:hypothetical protein